MLGAFDKAHIRGILSSKNYTVAKSKFLHENKKAGVLQIVSARMVNAAEFLTGDKRIYEAAKTEGLNAVLTN